MMMKWRKKIIETKLCSTSRQTQTSSVLSRLQDAAVKPKSFILRAFNLASMMEVFQRNLNLYWALITISGKPIQTNTIIISSTFIPRVYNNLKLKLWLLMSPWLPWSKIIFRITAYRSIDLIHYWMPFRPS